MASTDSGVILRRDAATFCWSTTATNRSRSSPDGTSKTSSASSSAILSDGLGGSGAAGSIGWSMRLGEGLQLGELLGLLGEDPGQRVELPSPAARVRAGRAPELAVEPVGPADD